MENIMIDSCVFFKMLEFNTFVENHGKENLFDYLQKMFNRTEKLKEEIQSQFCDEFLAKYGKLSFEEQIDKYKQFANARETYLQEAEKNLRRSQGIVMVKGKERKIEVSEERKQFFLNKYYEFKAKYNSIIPFTYLKDKISIYKLKLHRLEAGVLYKKVLDGEYKLYTNFISFAEVLKHTDPGEKKYYSRASVDSLSKLCTIVTASSDKALQAIDELALAYRTRDAEDDARNQKEMGDDLNSLGEYGDSKIAAIANICGMILITQNGKDFIFDKANGKNNERIRRHLRRMNTKFDYTSNASVYSPEELFSGDYFIPQNGSKVFTLVSSKHKMIPVSNKGTSFESEVEMS